VSITPENLRELLHRKAMAGERHRANAAWLLRMADTELTALGHLAQHGQLTPGELGRLLGLSSGGTTALLHRLDEAGHLTRHPHPSDKRSCLLTASRAVVERAEEIYAPLVEDMDELALGLSDDERAEVARYLTRVAALSERHAERLDTLLREKQRDAIGERAPGLWA
jgi:DNA-binding MarR family transcriptional regulator